MYNYYTNHQPKQTVKKSKMPFYLMLLVVLLVGIWLIRLVANNTYAKQTRDIPSVESIVLPAYTQKVSRETDIAKLVNVGNGLLDKNLPIYAATAFNKASDLDPNYRDAAYAWGYALMQARNGDLSAAELAQVKTAIDRAEIIDPMYVPLLQLKLLVANIEKNTEVAQATESRLKALTK
jgi:hypothetical protein